MVLSMEKECVARKNKEKSRLGFRRCFSFILSLIITVTVVLQCLPPMQIYAEDSEQINYSNEMLLKALVNNRPFVIEMLTGDEYLQIATPPGQQGRNSRSADAIISGQLRTQFPVSSQISSIIEIPLGKKRETKQRRSTNGLQTSVGVTLHQWNERQRDCGGNR